MIKLRKCWFPSFLLALSIICKSQAKNACKNSEIPLIANGRIPVPADAKITEIGKRLQLLCSKPAGQVLRGSGYVECTKHRQWRVNGFCEKANACDFIEPANKTKGVVRRAFEHYYGNYDSAFSPNYYDYDLVPTILDTIPSPEDTTTNYYGNDCRDIPEITNGFISTVFILRHGSAIGTMHCKPGYLLHGHYTVKCQPNGVWTIEGRCEHPESTFTIPLPSSNYCVDPPFVENGFVAITGPGAGVLACMPGFFVKGSEFAECNLQTGEWTVFGLCDSVALPPPSPDCRHVKEVKNGFIAVEIYPGHWKTRGILMCNDGFQLEGSEDAQCDHVTGLWQVHGICANIRDISIHDIANDLAIPCKTRLSVENGYIEPSITLPYQGKTLGLLHCNLGFFNQGKELAECYHNDARWRLSGSCTGYPGSNVVPGPIWPPHEVCNPVPLVPNGKIVTFYRWSPIGSIAVLTCNIGYTVKGSHVVQCGRDGNWQVNGWCKPPPPVPRWCQSVPSVKNGAIFVTTFPALGSKAKLVCNSGYYVSGKPTVTCGWDAKWQLNGQCVKKPSPPKMCGQVPIVQNGSVTSSSKGFIGDREYLHCNPGFELEGSAYVICDLDAVWKPNGRCIPKAIQTCLTVPAVPSGKVTIITYNTTNAFGKLDCNTGYTISCNNVLICHYGKWQINASCLLLETGSTPGPTPRDCQPMEVIENGLILNGKVSCNTGYLLSGCSDALCDRLSGKWQTSGKCQLGTSTSTITEPTKTTTKPIRACGPIPAITNGFVIDTTGPKLAVLCNPGYTRIGTNLVLCDNVSGKWVLNATCVPQITATTPMKRCPTNRPLIANGQVGTVSSGEIGDSETVTCNTGYRLNGSQEVKCGSDGVWQLNATCDLVPNECPIPPQLVNGLANSSEGDMASLACNDGYVMLGDSVAKCGPNGEWLFITTCLELSKSCLNTTQIPGGFITVTATNNSIYTGELNCLEGLTLEGPQNATCNTWDGLWKSDGICSVQGQNKCGEPVIENGHAIPFIAGSISLLECNPGYSLVGADYIECENGSWIIKGSCQAVPTTSSPIIKPECLYMPTIEHGFVITNIDGDYVATCDPGYELDKPENDGFECTDGKWLAKGQCQLLISTTTTTMPQTTLPIVNTECPYVPTVEHGIVVISPTIGDYAIVCDQGYQLDLFEWFECLNGRWNPFGHCLPTNATYRAPNNISAPILDKNCSYIPTIDHGSVEAIDGDYVINCDQGYELDNPDYEGFECSDGKWIPDGQCRLNTTQISTSQSPIIDQNCPNIPTIEHGAVYIEGSYYSVKCDPDFSPSGDIFIGWFYCSDGVWNPNGACVNSSLLDRKAIETTPSCPTEPFLVTNGVVIPDTSISAILECLTGYQLTGSANVTCDPTNGTWTLHGICIEWTMCSQLPQIDNAIVTPIGQSDSFVAAQMVCQTGYDLDGPSSLECSDGVWTILGKCVETKECPSVPLVENGQISSEGPSNIGAIRQITCNEGHLLRGSSIVRCTKKSKWLIKGLCTVSSCNDLPYIELILNT